MDLTAFVLIVGILVFIALFGVGYVLSIGTLDLKKRLFSSGAEAETEKSKLGWGKYVEGSERVFRSLGEVVPRSADEMSRQENRLAQAGIRRKDGTILFLGVQFALVLMLLIGFAITGYLQSNVVLFPILSILLGAMLPDLWLRWRMRIRRQRIQEALADTLDLLVICVEAGLGLDQSLLLIGQENRKIYPELSDELNRLNIEMKAGVARADALRNLSRRCGVEDLKALIAVLIQTDRFGTSVAQSLRVFSSSLRTKRTQRAEEKAAKMSIKMVPPLVLCVFPAIFVWLVGPAVIVIHQQLLPIIGEAAGQ